MGWTTLTGWVGVRVGVDDPNPTLSSLQRW